MLTYSSINCSNDRGEFNCKFEKLLNGVFQMTHNVNAHVLYNFKCPTNQLGEYDYILFVDIPYSDGNFYRSKKGIYLNTLAIAVRKFDEPEIIDADDNCFYTKDGSWDYVEEIEYDRQALRRFVFESFPDIKHFNIALIYQIKASNCNKKFRNNNMCFNTGVKLWEAIDDAVDFTQNKKGTAADCILYKQKDTNNEWSSFIPRFIELSDLRTKQGILTKKRIDYITNKKIGRLMEQAIQAAGNKLCIIRGKAGTGKSLSLLKLMYEEVRNGDDAPRHNCRLLTFNNMLVMDLRQVLKNIGEFTPTKASISTLHKFFYDIYKNSPVRFLHMDGNKINSLFNLCMVRTLKFNSLIYAFSHDCKTNDMNKLTSLLDEEAAKQDGKIKEEERAEWKEYQKYLYKIKNISITGLNNYAQDYVLYKRNTFLENYYRQEFLNGYNVILEELYLIFHNLDDFLNKYKLKISYTKEEVGNSFEFQSRYQNIYNQFMREAEGVLQNEYGDIDSIVPNYLQRLETLDKEIANNYNSKSQEEQKTDLTISLKKIKRKVNWSKLILVDEAQDCQINEKALILELNGSDNTVIATGGKDQLIRTAQENDWTQLFGHKLDVEKITLRSTSFRQKGNIINFLNAFAEIFNIETRLNVPEETMNSGRVIIDCRIFPENAIPLDYITSLHMHGMDMGCSNYENMMFLLPQEGYVQRKKTEDVDVTIDNNSTILITPASAERKLSMDLPKDFYTIDATVNDKRKALERVGQNNTRCLLYESCRGLEAWTVMCMDINDFYHDKLMSKDAEDYAITLGGGLFEEDKNRYTEQYASLWCFMAMTRAIDTLYIKLSNTQDFFSQRLLELAAGLPQVNILNGNYDGPIYQDINQEEENEPPVV